MAGARETPRQKMIGMMYLVLTALLALQIKDTVLEKFVLIDEGLKTSNATYSQANSQSIAGIQKAFTDLGSSDNDRPVVEAAQQIRQETDVILQYLEDWKTKIGDEVGGPEPDGHYTRAKLKKYEEPSRLLVEDNGAAELKQRLDGYNQSVMDAANAVFSEKGFATLNWGSLALAAKDIPFYQANPKLSKEDFAHLNFYKSPLASVLAQLTFFQNQILSRESEALGKLGGAIGASNIKGFDQISATVLPTSNIVTAGTDFEAEMFLTASSTSLTPSMTLGNTSLQVDEVTGRGKIKFKASARENEYNAQGLARKTFTGTVKYQQNGEDVEAEVVHEYFVAKPTIEVRSEAIETLLLNCANNLTIDVPSLGPAYQPSFTTTGGDDIPGSQKGQLTVVPKSAEVKIDVSSAGTYIGQKVFKVEAPPMPQFEVFVDGKRYDAQKGVTTPPRQFRLLVKPDENFKRKYPEDARYAVSKGRILRATGSIGKGSITISQPTVDANVNTLRAGAKAGDRYVIEIDEIIRVNYNNEQIRIPYNKTVEISIN